MSTATSAAMTPFLCVKSAEAPICSYFLFYIPSSEEERQLKLNYEIGSRTSALKRTRLNMMRLVVLLIASYVLVTQATIGEVGLEAERDGRKLAGTQSNATQWAQNYMPGQVMTAQDEERSAIGIWPAATGTALLARPITVGPASPFDGGMRVFKRSNVAYRSGTAMTQATAVFVIQAGGTLSNAIIAGGGGIFCETNNCALVNVWFKDSIQGALYMNSGTGITTVTGGGARNVARHIIFGQASGTVVVSGGFYMENSGMLFESCGTCGPVKRGIIVDGVVNVNPTAELIRVNSNYNDRGTISKATIITNIANYPVCTRFAGGTVSQLIGSGAVPPICSYTGANVVIRSP